jgi:hypothetical protein
MADSAVTVVPYREPEKDKDATDFQSQSDPILKSFARWHNACRQSFAITDICALQAQ